MDQIALGFVKEAGFGARLRKVLQRASQGGYARRTLDAARDVRSTRKASRGARAALVEAASHLDPPAMTIGDARLRSQIFDDALSGIRLNRARGVYGTAKDRLKDAPFVRGLGLGLGALALGSLAYSLKTEDS